MPAIDPQRYPKCKYSASSPAVLVDSPDEEKELGPGWFDHPDLVRELKNEPEVERTLAPETTNLLDLKKPAKVKPSAVTSGNAS